MLKCYTLLKIIIKLLAAKTQAQRYNKPESLSMIHNEQKRSSHHQRLLKIYGGNAISKKYILSFYTWSATDVLCSKENMTTAEDRVCPAVMSLHCNPGEWTEIELSQKWRKREIQAATVLLKRLV